MVKMITHCQNREFKTKLDKVGKINYWMPKLMIFQIWFYGRFSYESSLQHNFNYSLVMPYEKVKQKILIVCPKSTLLKLCFLVCSLAYLTHQFF